MSAGDIAVLVASAVCSAAVVGLFVSIGSLRRQIRALAELNRELGGRTANLVDDAHRTMDQAAIELERVGAVLDSTRSVQDTVDSASRLAYRAFANPVVKVLAVRAGAASGIRRLATGPDTVPGDSPSRSASRNGSR